MKMRLIHKQITKGFYILFLLLGLSGCFDGGSNNGPTVVDPPPPPPPVVNTLTLTYDLNGTQQVPMVTTTAQGNGTLTLDLDSGALTGSVTTAGVEVTATHIHSAFAGANGGVLVTLTQSTTDTAQWLVPDGTVLSAEAIQSYSAGRLYINVHSDAYPSGEIRGQVLADNIKVVWSTLTGANQIPPVNTTASGRAALTINNDTMAVVLNAMTTDLDDATAAHIHQGFAAQNGGVALSLEQDADDMNHWVASGEFTQEQVDILWAGGLYVNVHSNTNPAGEIRGQLMADNIKVVWADLAGNDQMPSVETIASGRAALTINNDTMAVVLHAMTADLDDATAAHIHQGFAGQNGGVALSLEQDADDMNHWWAAGEFTQEQVDMLWAGGLYVNIHSSMNPGGEVRGQLMANNIKVVWADLSGSNQVPAVDTIASGRAALTINADTMAVVIHTMTANLGDATAAHIHQGFAAQNGGVVLNLDQDADDMNHWWAAGEFTQEQVDMLWAGGLYVNIHSSMNPGGEVRGQLMANNIKVVWADLSGSNQVPAVDTIASGRAALTINADTMAVVIHTMTADLDDATAAHIHQGFAGENGGVVLGLEQDADDINHWWAAGEFTQEQVEALWASGLYVNVHSSMNPGGEVRGQLME